MKEVKWESLGEYFKEEAEEYFGHFYSNRTEDYSEDFDVESDIINQVKDYKRTEIYYQRKLEISETGKPPLILEFISCDVFDDKDNLVDIHYYLDEGIVASRPWLV